MADDPDILYTHEWEAYVDTIPGFDEIDLRVEGTLELAGTNYEPRLIRVDEQGNGGVLALELDLLGGTGRTSVTL